MDQLFELTKETLMGRTLICTVNPASVPGAEIIHDGQVIAVDEAGKKIAFIYVYGLKSYTDIVPFADVLAVPDERGERLTIGPFTGTFIDLRQKE